MNKTTFVDWFSFTNFEIMPSQSKVCFFFDKKGFDLRNRTRLKRSIEMLFGKEKRTLHSLNYVFCSDERLLEINRQFLHHNYYTDIITFDLSEGVSTQAEIYISVDRVKENARSLGVSFKSELHRVILHGALHLCGYRDKSKPEIEEMRKMEDYCLSKYFK